MLLGNADIIDRILEATDANGFSSLILLNRRWRRVSQQAHLYRHHLSRGSDLKPSIQSSDNELSQLRKQFAEEIKRNLYDSYVRPRETVIRLVSTSASSSSAFPGGEAFHFSFSPSGRYVLAFNSARIYMLDISTDSVVVKKEFRILRRPVTVTMLDDASLLAVLSSDHQVDIYDLTGPQAKHSRALALDYPPRAIALSPTGSILAAAYDGGIEVYSLAKDARPAERRAVKCDATDSLSFSRDGTQLLGTTTHSRYPSTVILTAPYADMDGISAEEGLPQQTWTTSILFPNSSRDCSHAVLLPGTDYETTWTFTYDRVFETFRAVRIDDLRNGTTHFTGPATSKSSLGKLLPSTLPATNKNAELVAAGFQGSEIWLYGIPSDLEAGPDPESDSAPTSPLTTIGRRNSSSTARNFSRTWNTGVSTNRVSQWQQLSDQNRNTFVTGRKIATLEGVNMLRWLDSPGTFSEERLAVVASGRLDQLSGTKDEGLVPVDGGRITLLDFMNSTSNGEKRFWTIELGESEADVLEEERREIDADIELVRRRTVAQRSLSRQDAHDLTDPIVEVMASNSSKETKVSTESEDDQEVFEDAREALDAPYSQADPRSESTLRRAATAAATSRRPPRFATPNDDSPLRQASDRTEHPHESDADNWVPPPPPYTPEVVDILPHRLRNAISPPSDNDPHDNGNEEPRSMLEDITAANSNSTIDSTVQGVVLVEQENLYDVSVPASPSLVAIHSDNVEASPLQHQAEQLDTESIQAPIAQSITRIGSATSDTIGVQPELLSSAEVDKKECHVRGSTLSLSTTHSVGPSSTRPAPLDLARSKDDTHLKSTSNQSPYLKHLSPTVPQTPDTVTDVSISSEDSRPATPNDNIASTSEPQVTSVEPAEVDELVMPSADQVARLNSRRGRPPNRVLSDPSRKRSGSGSRPKAPSSAAPAKAQDASALTPPQRPTPGFATPPRVHSPSGMNVSPRSVLGAYNNSSPSHSPTRRPPLANNRYSSSSPAIRPRMSRLETIHSHTSNDTEMTGQAFQTSGLGGGLGNGVRRGWRGSFKRKQRPNVMKRESADWNELLKQGQAHKQEMKKQRKRDKKCIVM
jgi:hypothetical protein